MLKNGEYIKVDLVNNTDGRVIRSLSFFSTVGCVNGMYDLIRTMDEDTDYLVKKVLRDGRSFDVTEELETILNVMCRI